VPPCRVRPRPEHPTLRAQPLGVKSPPRVGGAAIWDCWTWLDSYFSFGCVFAKALSPEGGLGENLLKEKSG